MNVAHNSMPNDGDLYIIVRATVYLLRACHKRVSIRSVNDQIQAATGKGRRWSEVADVLARVLADLGQQSGNTGATGGQQSGNSFESDGQQSVKPAAKDGQPSRARHKVLDQERELANGKKLDEERTEAIARLAALNVNARILREAPTKELVRYLDMDTNRWRGSAESLGGTIANCIKARSGPPPNLVRVPDEPVGRNIFRSWGLCSGCTLNDEQCEREHGPLAERGPGGTLVYSPPQSMGRQDLPEGAPLV